MRKENGYVRFSLHIIKSSLGFEEKGLLSFVRNGEFYKEYIFSKTF